jgi:hypothetical protein
MVLHLGQSVPPLLQGMAEQVAAKAPTKPDFLVAWV